MNKKIVIGNWKMNPQKEEDSLRLASEIEEGINNVENEVVIAPPFVFLSSIKKELDKIKLGAQDLFWENKGAYTGEISADQLKDLGAEYVIVGHSERRSLGETNKEVSKKIKISLERNLTPIVCVGESLETHKEGEKSLKEFIENQIKECLSSLSLEENEDDLILVAYEPLWAISSNEGAEPASPNDISYVSDVINDFIKNNFSYLNIKVLYGGSVDSGNVESFGNLDSIDGFLIGSASLSSEEFVKVIKLLN